MPRRKCVFNQRLQEEFKFLEKDQNDSHLHCKICDGRFSISHGGRSDITMHLKARKHLKASGESSNIVVIKTPKIKPVIEDIRFCRTCRSNLDTSSATNLFGKDEHDLVTKIQDITGCLLKNEKDLPKHICENCEENLEAAHKFRVRCLDTQTYFSSAEFKQEGNKSIKTGHEQHMMIVPQELAEVMLDIKDENSSVDDNESNALDFNDDHEINDLPSVKSERSNSPVQAISISNDNSLKDIDVKVAEKTSATGETETTKKSNQTKEIKVKYAKEKTELFCDRCGNHFTSRQHFKTHLLRHDNQKPYKCEVCPKQCYTASELKRHMRRHTGERPFACKHCQRSFADYSTRLRHERIHTNERPYLCPQCGKAFTRSSLLKKHTLVHTGERAFKCSACNKAFQTQAHLTVHCRSIMHKQMVEKQAQITGPNDVQTKTFE